MASDERMLAMHAVLRKANGSASVKGKKSYKLAFAYPRGFVASVDEFLGERVDIYWNETLVAHDALFTGTRSRAVPDSDPDYLMSFDASSNDTGLMNGSDVVNDSGDLRLVAKQMAMSL